MNQVNRGGSMRSRMKAAAVAAIVFTTLTVRGNAQTRATANSSAASVATAAQSAVTRSAVNVRQGPGPQYAWFASLEANASLTEIDRNNGWSQVRLSDGRTGWLGSKYLRYVPGGAAPVTTFATSTPPAAHTVSPAPPAAAGHAPSATPSKPAAHRAPQATTRSAAAAPSVSSLLVDTRKDPFAGGSGASVGVGDAFRLLFYLLPILGLIVLAVRGLKRFQEKTGWSGALPTSRKSLLGGLNMTNARKTGGSSIRVLESVPLGGNELSLVEVRGRLLLLACGGGAVTLLTELKDAAPSESEFDAMLGSLTADDDTVDLDGTIGATVGSLDDSLRETREAIVRSAQRTLRSRASVNEGDIDEMVFGARAARR